MDRRRHRDLRLTHLRPTHGRLTHRHLDQSSVKPARAALLLAAATTLSLAGVAGAANYTFSNPLGGATNVSTNYTPVGLPGASDTLIIDDLPRITGGLTLTVPTNQAIAGLTYSHYGQTSINGPGVLTLQTGMLTFNDAIREVPGEPLDSLFINATIAGSAGLTKSGPGFALLSGTNTYTGGTTINGTGGLTVLSDASLGATSAGITLNGGTLRAGSTFTTTRTLTVGSDGGRLDSYAPWTMNGNIVGSGLLRLGGSSSAVLTLGGTVSKSGTLAVVAGATVNLLGRITGSDVSIAGTLSLGSGSTGPSVDALRDTGLLESFGGTLRVVAGSSNVNEVVGGLALSTGMTSIDLGANVNGGVAIQFAQLGGMPPNSVQNTLFVRGRDLGAGPTTANQTNITFLNTANLSGVGGSGTTATNDSIIRLITGNANVTGGMSQASVVDAGLVTYGPYGLRPLSAADYATTIGVDATDNVRVSDGVVTRSTAATVNALVIRDTLASGGNSGITGAGTLTITSGTIAAVSDLSGEELFINNPIDVGAAGLIVHTLPAADGLSQLSLRGAISGSNGLIKSGQGELQLTSTASSYTGGTSIQAGTLIFEGNVPVSGDSALGNGGRVVVNAGTNDNRFTQLLAATPNSIFSREILILQPTSLLFASDENGLAVLGTRGGVGTTFAGLIQLIGVVNLVGDADPDNVLTFSGGFGTYSPNNGGALQEPDVPAPQFQYLRFTGNGGYSGGTIIRAGQWQVGSNTALGTGTIFFAGNNTADATGGISAYGGARTLANPLVFRDAPVFSGADALTFTGSVDLGGATREIITDNTADTTFAGVVGRGGIIKNGAGRLTLSNNGNTYNGQTIVYDGALRASAGSALGVAAGTVNPNQGTFVVNTGVLELSGGISTSEAIYFGAGGLPITSGNAAGNLRSVSGNNTITESIAFDAVGTVGVDAGSTLTLAGDTLDNTLDSTPALRKVGAGTLVVKNVRLPTLDVQAGTVRVSVAGVPVGTSRVSSLSVASGALLDLGNNTLIYDYTSVSPQADVRTLLGSGRIDTTSGGVKGAVGYAEASSLYAAGTFPQSYAGQVFDNTTLILTYTIGGDADLNRSVNFDDLLALARNYGGAGKVWIQGDFDYDADVDFDDLLTLARSYNTSAPASASPLSAEFNPTFAADWALAQSLVPEPTTLGALMLLTPLARRRR